MKTNKKMMMLSFIGIIIVVLGHTGNQIKLMNDIFPYYSFHMVLFIFISGYFYKPENEKNIWGRKGYIFKRIKKMVIPYFIWNLIYGIIINIFKVAKIIPYGDSINLNSLFIKPWITGHQFVLNIASWFLLALFLVNIVYILIRKITSKIKIWNDYIAIFVFFIISIISIYLSNKNLSQNYIPIMRTGFFIFFYHLGYIYKTKIEGKFKINTIVYLLLIITIQLIVFKVDGNISYIVAFMKFDNKFIITPIIVSITGVLFWLKISEILEPALGKSKIVNYISNHTFDIMLHHLFIVFVVNVCIYKISDVFGLNGFDVQKFKNTIYYYYTAGVKQLPILYTIIAIIIPLSIRYICEQIKLKIVNKESLYMKYDYLIVGSGLFGSIFAYEANKRGKKCLVIDKRPNVAGNIYTENVDGINIHKYGAHIFHTNNKEVWQYINQFAEFNRYTNSPVARYKDELYNMPFNMNTFNKLWGVFTPEEAKNKIEQEKKEAGITEPKNLEEQAISLVGKTIYEKLVKGYTEKQWGKRATELPSFIIKRLPVRFTYDNNYFNALYQGIPVGGYTQIIEKLLEGIEVKLNYDFFEHREELENIANKIIFTGPIDKYYNYEFGELEYRSLRFETEELNIDNYQGNAVVNYTEYEIPYTRIIEHKHFEYGGSLVLEEPEEAKGKTIITKEYPDKWIQGKEPYYTMNDSKNTSLYNKYKELADKDNKVVFGGRLGQYKYFDMDKTIEEALKCVNNEL